MSIIASLSQQILQYTNGGGETLFYFKDITSTTQGLLTTGAFTDFWRFPGIPGDGGAVPTSPTAPTRTTVGALPFFINPSGSQQKWIIRATIAPALTGNFYLYDRLLHVSGLSGTSTSVQTVGGTLTRYTDAEAAGNRAYVQIYSPVGTTGTTLTVNYTDHAGASRTTVVPLIGSTGFREIGKLIPIIPIAGTRGFRSVDSVQLAASTGTTGDFGITILRNLVDMSCSVVGSAEQVDVFGKPGGVEIRPDACLAAYTFASGITQRKLWAKFTTVRV